MTDLDDEQDLSGLQADGQEALARLLSRYQPRLERMIDFRLDQRLKGRIDTSDLLQEAYLKMSQRLASYLKAPAVPVFIWMRQITEQVLVDVHRRHMGARMRSANREVSLDGNRGGTSVALAARLIADVTSVSNAAIREEMTFALRQALDSMDPIDREVLALRHFEELGNNEVADVLGIKRAAASNRYIRAVARLRTILQDVPGFPGHEDRG